MFFPKDSPAGRDLVLLTEIKAICVGFFSQEDRLKVRCTSFVNSRLGTSQELWHDVDLQLRAQEEIDYYIRNRIPPFENFKEASDDDC